MTSINLRGIPLLVHDHEDLSNAIVRNGDFWEADILDYMRDRHTYQHTIIDIGANIGNHTVYFANFLTYNRIIAFEPDKANYDVLTVNTFQYPSVYTYNTAIGDYTGETWLQLNHSNWGAHETHDIGDYKVRMAALDEYVYLGDVTLMKIDVEWSEPQVLRGAYKTILYNRPLILIEDVRNEYAALPELSNYELEYRWDHHGTSLYRWRE